jgi:hypothetical protein
MKRTIRRTGSYGDQKVNQLARDTQSGFDAILDQTVHKITAVWNPPLNIALPFFGNIPRQLSPDVVECKRAINLTDSTIRVTPGGCAWEWLGNNQARIDAVSGLTVGSKYELTFVAVG